MEQNFQILDRHGLAKLMNTSPATLGRWMSQCPSRMPPAVDLGSGRRIWILETVVAWLKAKQQPLAQVNDSAALTTVKKRGRPTKAVLIDLRHGKG